MRYRSDKYRPNQRPVESKKEDPIFKYFIILTISYQNVGNNTSLLTDFDVTMIKYARSIRGMTSGVL